MTIKHMLSFVCFSILSCGIALGLPHTCIPGCCNGDLKDSGGTVRGTFSNWKAYADGTTDGSWTYTTTFGTVVSDNASGTYTYDPITLSSTGVYTGTASFPSHPEYGSSSYTLYLTLTFPSPDYCLGEWDVDFANSQWPDITDGQWEHTSICASPMADHDQMNIQKEINDIINHCDLAFQRKDVLHSIIRCLWEQFPKYSFLDIKTGEMILNAWRNELEILNTCEDTMHFLIEICTLRWQTYHAILTAHSPLSKEMLRIKKQQKEKLFLLLKSISKNMKVSEPYYNVAQKALEYEINRSITRLDIAMESPMEPLCYYPLPEPAFPKAVASIEKRIQKEIEAFNNKFEAKKHSLLLDSLEKAKHKEGLIDFLQTDMREIAFADSRGLVSNVLGHLFGEYCILSRNPNFHDRNQFPFIAPKGIHATYRTVEGFTTRLVPRCSHGHSDFKNHAQ